MNDVERAIKEGRPFVIIAETGDGRITVSGSASAEWTARAIDVVREGLPTIRDTPETQCRIVETN